MTFVAHAVSPGAGTVRFLAPQPAAAGNIIFLPDHANAGNAATGIFDLSTNRWNFTFAGNAKNDNAQRKFGSGTSLDFDGTGDSVTQAESGAFIPTSAETEDTGEFSFEMDLWLDGLGVNQTLYSRDNGASLHYWDLRVSSTNKIQFQGSDARATIGSLLDISGTASLTTSTWYHIAVSRQNGVSGTPGAEDIIRLFVDGQVVASQTLATANGFDETGVGADLVFGDIEAGGQPLNGRLDNIRIVVGEAFYVGPFIIPKDRHPGENDDLLAIVDPVFSSVLFLMDDGADESTTMVDISTGGAGSPHSPAIVNSVKHDNASLAFAGDTSAILFTGADAAITTASHADFQFGSVDWGFDMWFKSSVGGRIMAKYDFNSNRAFILDVGAADGVAVFHHYGAKASSSSEHVAYPALSAGNLLDDVWHHVLFTHEEIDAGASMRGSIFIDGLMRWTQGNTNFPIDVTSSPFRFGNDANLNGDYTGLIAWPRLWRGVVGPTSSFLKPTTRPPLS